MAPVLQRANKPVPRVLVYQDKGTGASILRAGVRLWAPGAIMPVAAIKIVRHNLYRPTSLFHETGHQVAFLTDWMPSVRDAISRALADDAELQAMWTPWASEIAADVYAFLHTGYASVAALYDVVGDARHDPALAGRRSASDRLAAHRAGLRFLRAVLRRARPVGQIAARDAGTLSDARRRSPRCKPLLVRSMKRHARDRRRLPVGTRARTGRQADDRRARSGSACRPPHSRNSNATAVAALWSSAHWRRSEGIRIVALAGLREAEHPETAPAWIDRARAWLTTEARVA